MKRLAFILSAFLLMGAINDELNQSLDLKKLEKSMACIPKGSFVFYDSSSEINLELKANVPGKKIAVDSFYMYTHEVSNNDYHVFLNDLKAKYIQQYARMLPDTMVWKTKQGYMEPYVKYYFSHPAYGDYPVVGVSHAQAESYCQWLTVKYMSMSKRKYKKVKFELPTIYQWEYAAIGHAKDYTDFPWGGPFMRNSKGKFMANFMNTPESSVKREKVYVKDSAGNFKEVNLFVASSYGAMGEYDQKYGVNNVADITTPVISYWPNDYGLYNMAGNVKEYVREQGITKGGGWRDTGFYLMNAVEQSYESSEPATNDRGFRFIMEIIK